jgi:hypothetical protein
MPHPAGSEVDDFVRQDRLACLRTMPGGTRE